MLLLVLPGVAAAGEEDAASSSPNAARSSSGHGDARLIVLDCLPQKVGEFSNKREQCTLFDQLARLARCQPAVQGVTCTNTDTLHVIRGHFRSGRHASARAADRTVFSFMQPGAAARCVACLDVLSECGLCVHTGNCGRLLR
jgi:hypothetical protein